MHVVKMSSNQEMPIELGTRLGAKKGWLKRKRSQKNLGRFEEEHEPTIAQEAAGINWHSNKRAGHSATIGDEFAEKKGARSASISRLGRGGAHEVKVGITTRARAGFKPGDDRGDMKIKTLKAKSRQHAENLALAWMARGKKRK